MANVALKKNGVFVALAGNTAITKNDFLTMVVRSSAPLKSGDLYKTYMCEFNMEFNDYYWTLADFQYAFFEAGFNIKEIHFPLGKKEDNIPWRDELYESPYIILVSAIK